MKKLGLTVVHVNVTGKAAELYELFSAQSDLPIMDMRLSPFIPVRPDLDVPLIPVTVEANRLFYHHGFYDQVMRKFFRNQDECYMGVDDYIATLNNWLAIIDHFGVDADYTQEFFDIVENVIIEIMVYGYLKDGDDPYTADRFFNGRQLTHTEFYDEWLRLFMRYVPKRVIRG